MHTSLHHPGRGGAATPLRSPPLPLCYQVGTLRCRSHLSLIPQGLLTLIPVPFSQPTPDLTYAIGGPPDAMPSVGHQTPRPLAHREVAMPDQYRIINRIVIMAGRLLASPRPPCHKKPEFTVSTEGQHPHAARAHHSVKTALTTIRKPALGCKLTTPPSVLSSHAS